MARTHDARVQEPSSRVVNTTKRPTCSRPMFIAVRTGRLYLCYSPA